MPYEVEVREVQPQPVAAIRMTTTMAGIGAAVGQIFPEVSACLERQGVTPSGPPFVRYHSFEDDAIDLEAGLPVATAVTGEGEVSPGELPGGRVALTTHVGPYETIGAAHEAVNAWIGEQGLQPAGAPWERYLTDPNQVKDPAEWRTEVLYPIQ
jgi:effector-binding domain-containing protein